MGPSVAKENQKPLSSDSFEDVIRIRGARQHNLKNVDLTIPRNKFIVFTGGEPLLQLDLPLIKNIKKNGFIIAIETNGTLPVPGLVDWVCVSPKAKSKLLLKKGNEIKIIYPQEGLILSNYKKLNFEHFYLQPLDNKDIISNRKKVIEYILKNPSWKLSLQTHKYLGIK